VSRRTLSEPTLDGWTPVLELEQVSVRYGRGTTEVRALDDVSLVVNPGEFVAVMGPSGSGKSTLVHVAAGLATPNRGTVRVEGSTVGGNWGWPELRRRRIGVVFQRLNLVPTLSAIENVMVPLILDRVRQHDARAAAHAALDRAGLCGVDDQFPAELSGGEQQRVAIARALVGERRLLLADEPTGALDTVTSDQVVRHLAERARDGNAVVMVTHESRLAAWADRVVSLEDGRLVDDAFADTSLRWRS
jgi:putative ABC transport system ATP-binding protein